MSTPSDLARRAKELASRPAPDFSTYSKKTGAKATVGESRQIAQMVTVPAIITARWAVGIACFALVVSLLAVYLAVVLR